MLRTMGGAELGHLVSRLSRQIFGKRDMRGHACLSILIKRYSSVVFSFSGFP
jgi:hypothetical protein